MVQTQDLKFAVLYSKIQDKDQKEVKDMEAGKEGRITRALCQEPMMKDVS